MRAAKEAEKAQEARHRSARNALQEALVVGEQALSLSLPEQPLSLSLINEVPVVCNASFGAHCACYLDSLIVLSCLLR